MMRVVVIKKTPKQKLIYFYLLMFPKHKREEGRTWALASVLKPPLKGQSTDFKVKA